MEKIYFKLEELIVALVESYSVSRHHRSVNIIEENLRRIYKFKDVFQYILERFYADPRNPFTTAYSRFMNFLDSGLDPEEIFFDIAENILLRRAKEQEKGEYVVF